MNRQQRRAAERQGKSVGDTAAPGAPGAGEFDFAQAVQLHQAGRLQEADRQLQRIAPGDPRRADALHLRGVIGLQANAWGQAAELIGQAIAVDPTAAVFHNNLGMALLALGRLAEAETCFRQALALRPDYPKALSNLERALVALAGELIGKGRGGEAIPLLQRALAINPKAVALHGALATALEGEVRLTEAAAVDRQAVRLQGDPDEIAHAYNALGNCLANLGDIDGAVAAYRQAIARNPADPDVRSNLLMTLHSLASLSAADLLVEARRNAPPAEARPAAGFGNDRDPARRLKVGYVSADFRTHPVGFFLERVLAAHDPGAVEPILYSNSLYADDHTERLRAAAAGWRSLVGLDDAAARALIEADGVDILIDLAGHTGGNRLGVFAARAAPVQAAWLGYFGTTGVAAMDYVLADAVVLPPGDEAVFSEAVERLPAPYLCWSPPIETVETAPFPALANGYVTFGCFNNRAKLVPEVIDVWARILTAVEGSRLFLKSWSLADAGNRDGLRAAFEARGVSGERLMFEGLTPRVEALAAYNRVDIALDPFPFGGCTTTADTLWMGVPLVTLAGERWSGRMSRTILAAVGLEDWVAESPEAYVDKAVAMANDLAALASVRVGLRTRLEASAFCDGPAFTPGLEAVYRRMWRRWCETPPSRA